MGTEIRLSDGFLATIRDRDEITERMNRVVDRANTRALAVTAKIRRLAGLGLPADGDDERPAEVVAAENLAITEVFAQLSDDELDVFQAAKSALIEVMVEKWGIPEPVNPETIQGLAETVFEELAARCGEAWRREEFTISADPLAPTSESGGSPAT